MKHKFIRLSRRYASALRKHLRQGPKASLQPALKLGHEAVALGLETLQLARIHQESLAMIPPSRRSNGLTRSAEGFFNEALTPIVQTHRAARQSKADLSRLNRKLTQRTTELAHTSRELQRGVARRENVEAALKKSDEHYTKLLKESLLLQDRLRGLTHQVLAAQENERRQISTELQNEIAQTLLGINVRLLSLKKEAKLSSKSLKSDIASTERLVAKSAGFVRRTARNFQNT